MRFENVKAVVFDLDNTLIVRELALKKLVHYVNRFYFPGRESEHVLIGEAFCRAYADGYVDLEECFQNFRQAARLEAAVSFDAFHTMWQFYYPFCSSINPEATVVLELRRRGYRVGILTNGPSVMQQGKVDVVGFRDWFEFVLPSGEIGFHKPDIRAFHAAAQRMRLSPEEIAYVGDHPRNDVDAARRAGMPALWYSKYAQWDDCYVPPEVEVGSLEKLLEHFPAG